MDHIEKSLYYNNTNTIPKIGDIVVVKSNLKLGSYYKRRNKYLGIVPGTRYVVRDVSISSSSSLIKLKENFSYLKASNFNLQTDQFTKDDTQKDYLLVVDKKPFGFVSPGDMKDKIRGILMKNPKSEVLIYKLESKAKMEIPIISFEQFTK